MQRHDTQVCMLSNRHLAREGGQRLLRSHHVSPTQRPVQPPQPPAILIPYATSLQTSTSSGTTLSNSQQQQDAQQGQSPTSAYIHLPFCKRKCWYCDFPVQAVGQKLTSSHIHDRMVDYVDNHVCREVMSTPRLGNAPLQTVYFGGGTPSLVPPSLVGRILDTLDTRFGISTDAEISLEADPGTFDLDRLRQYMSLGVNRISMGVQSFQQELLLACGRSHTLDDVHRAIDAVHACGIHTWSLDLISGLPHLTHDKWQESLEQAIHAQPTHISVYDLQVEEGTPFSRWYSPGKRPLPEDEDAAVMYATASNMLRKAGYEHYEVSNYARPGHRSRHNQVYWVGASYYAFGQGAASYLAGRRFTRPPTIKAYSAWVESYTASSSSSSSSGSVPEDVLPGMDLPPQTKEDRMLECIMLRLRTSDGLNMDQFANEYGHDMADLVMKGLDKHVEAGHVLSAVLPNDARDQTAVALGGDGRAGGMSSKGLEREKRGVGEVGKGLAVPGAMLVGGGWKGMHVRLSDPQGLLMSNDIISDVFAAVSGA